MSIVSFKSEQIICQALAECNLQYFDAALIFGQETFSRIEGYFYSKASLINDLIIPSVPSDPHHMVFVDDSPEHVKDVSRNVGGSQTVWVKREKSLSRSNCKGGLSHCHCHQILKWASAPHRYARKSWLDIINITRADT